MTNPSDNVNHPKHYTTGKIEVIDFIEDKGLNFHRGNAVKYIARAGIKDQAKEIEDLQKAVWYLNREIERMLISRKIEDLQKAVWYLNREIERMLISRKEVNQNESY